MYSIQRQFFLLLVTIIILMWSRTSDQDFISLIELQVDMFD